MNRGRLLTAVMVAGVVGLFSMSGFIGVAASETIDGSSTQTTEPQAAPTTTPPPDPPAPGPTPSTAANSPDSSPSTPSPSIPAGSSGGPAPRGSTPSTTSTGAGTRSSDGTLQSATAPSGERCEATGAEAVRTDKRDYSPGETVTITGEGYSALCDVVVRVTRPDGSIVLGDGSFQPGSDTVTTDAAGNLLYRYQLDGIEGRYTVDVLGRDDLVLATTPFTDSTPRISATQHEGQKSDGTYTSGNVTQYAEGDSIKFRFTLDATQGPADGYLEVRFTGDDGDCLFFDGTFALGTVEDLGGPQPMVTVDGSPTAVDFGTSSGEWVQRLHIVYPTDFDHETNSARVNYTLKLSDEAGQCSGSSQHSRLSPAGGAVQQSGAQKVPVPANQIVVNQASVTVHKDFSDDNPAPVSVALACTDGTVTNSPQNASDEDAGGSPAVFTVTGFDNPNATCTATETVPPGYTASGEPEGTCTATLGGECTITNTLNQATVTVHKDYSDDNPAPVSVALECADGTVTDSPQNASDESADGAPAVFTVTGFDNPNATCTATETVPPGYTASGEPAGTCTATLGGECTITNTLIVIAPPPPPPPTPPPPAPPSPPPAPAAAPSTTAPPPPAPAPAPPIVEPVVVAPDQPIALTLIRNQLRRAFVPGQPVRLDGTAPAGCEPVLRVDGETVGPVKTDSGGKFAVDVDTSDLGAGQHRAEIVCPGGMILQTGFWVASPQTSSNTFSVVLVVLLVLCALGWVSVRGLTGRARADR